MGRKPIYTKRFRFWLGTFGRGCFYCIMTFLILFILFITFEGLQYLPWWVELPLVPAVVVTAFVAAYVKTKAKAETPIKKMGGQRKIVQSPLLDGLILFVGTSFASAGWGLIGLLNWIQYGLLQGKPLLGSNIPGYALLFVELLAISLIIWGICRIIRQCYLIIKRRLRATFSKTELTASETSDPLPKSGSPSS